MAFSDADGNFRFRGIAPGRHRLLAYPRDKSMRTFETDLDVGAAAVEGVQAGLVAARNGTVRLVVKDLDGKPVEGAMLTLVTDQGGGRTTATSLHATSDQPGVYVALVEAGRRTITAFRKDLRAGSVTVEVEEGKTAQADLVLQWVAGNAKGSLEVAGTVYVKGTKKPLSAAEVSLTIYTVSPWGFAGIARANADGRFHFKSLPPGTYRVMANPVKPVFRQAQLDVTLTAGTNKEGLEIALEECVAGKVKFTVTDTDGRPVDDLTFATVKDEGGGRSTSTGFAAERTAPGVYVAELEAGSHEVMVWRDGFQPFTGTVVVKKDGTVDVKVVLKPKR
jgi:protocatechuate 3,4-dioxygenase beta subunit